MKAPKIFVHSSVLPSPRTPLYAASLLLALLYSACGSWIGNPGKNDGDEEGEQPHQSVQVPGGSSAGALQAKPGEVFLQEVQLVAGQEFSADLNLVVASQLVDGDAATRFEVSLLAEDGTEHAYTRKGQDEAGIGFTPDVDGSYTVIMKNNSTATVELAGSVVSGAASAGEAVNAAERSNAPYKDYTLKAVVAFASVCKQYADGGNSTQSFTAPAGEYYVQPFVFWGKVGGDHKVANLSGANMTIKAGDVTINLQRLGDLELATYREHGSLSKDEHEAYTRAFYQQYFGAMGELYTLDTFRFGGDCAAAKTVKVPTDVGEADISLQIVDSSIGLDATYKIRPTISTAFSTYDAAGSRITDWTQCTYNRLTGEPTTYNGDAASCKNFSLAQPPYVSLDYQLPSAAGGGVTSSSDPTRILYYGHSFAREWYEEIITHADALAAGSKSSISLSRCLNNGGLIAVPISAAATYIPLGEFNIAVGDVVNLAQKTGSYTALTDFYQGNVNAASELTYPTCIPQGEESCAAFKLIKVSMSQCSLKADSGISVTSVGESFIYPEYFGVSGIITQ